jgi:RNA polymerase sigma-70 factor (ECF subfamily)
MVPERDRLFADAVRGNSTAFWQLVEPYSRLLGSVAWGIVHDQDATEDVVQETWVRAWQTLPSLKDPSKLSGWLYSMARNIALEHLRQRQKQERIASAVPPAEVISITELMVAEQELQLLREAMALIPEHHRVVLALKYHQGASCKEIADTLDVGVEAAKSRLFEARRILRDKMKSLSRDTSPERSRSLPEEAP